MSEPSSGNAGPSCTSRLALASDAGISASPSPARTRASVAPALASARAAPTKGAFSKRPTFLPNSATTTACTGAALVHAQRRYMSPTFSVARQVLAALRALVSAPKLCQVQLVVPGAKLGPRVTRRLALPE